LVRRASPGVRGSRRRPGHLPHYSTVHRGRSRGGNQSPVVRAPASHAEPIEANAPRSSTPAPIAQSSERQLIREPSPGALHSLSQPRKKWEARPPAPPPVCDDDVQTRAGVLLRWCPSSRRRDGHRRGLVRCRDHGR